MPDREHAPHRSPLLIRPQSGGTQVVRARSAAAASFVIIIALLAILAAVGFASWPTADDYCNRVMVGERGVGGALEWLFFEWSGRLASGAPLYTMFALVDLPALHWVSAGLACLLAIAGCQIGSLVAGDDLPLRWPLCAFAFAALTLGLYQLLGQAVLWSTGGIVYMVPLVLALLWLASVRRLLQGRSPRAGAALGFALGALAGNSIELVWPILLAYVGLVAPSRWRALPPASRRGLVARIVGLLAGMLLLVVAPGNYVRAAVTPGSFTFEPAYLAGQYFAMLREIVRATWPMIAIAASVALASALAAREARRAGVPAIELSPSRETIALAIGALASVVPVLAAPPQFAPRNGFYMVVFALVAALISFATYARYARWRPLAAPALITLAALASVAAGVPLFADARQSEAFRERQLARDRALRALPQRRDIDAIVPPIGVAVPRTLHFVELEPDRAQWNNVCTAKYYGLRSIALEPSVR